MIKTYILFSIWIEHQYRYFIFIFFFPHHLFCDDESEAIQHICKYDLYIYIK